MFRKGKYSVPHRRRLLRLFAHRFSVPLSLLVTITRAFITFLLILFIIASFVRIRYLKEEALIKDVQHRISNPTVEIFAAPPPLDNETLPNIRRAIWSWRALRPRPRITLLGHSLHLQRFAHRQRVFHDTQVDQNFLGRPLFNSIIHRTNLSTADVTVFVNADIVLLQDFIENIQKLSRAFPDFFAVGARYDVDEIPQLEKLGSESLRDRVISNGSLHNYGGMDFWAWSTRGPRLIRNFIPPFAYARGRYDNWLMHEVISCGRRPVIDLSETVVSVHERHMYKRSVPPKALALALAPSKIQKRSFESHEIVSTTPVSNFWSRGKSSNFELFLNIHLSLASGSYRDGYGTTRHSPWKMSACYEGDRICLLRRLHPGKCHCEYESFVPFVQMSSRCESFERSVRSPSKVRFDNISDYQIPVQVTRHTARNPRFGLPLTLLDALASVIQNGTVIISAVNYGYREVMMNWVCHMRRLRISNFLIAALDKELYRYSFKHGIAVYYEDSFENGEGNNLLSMGATYGSDAFRNLTKMKTRVVIRILRLGYDVMWSDCDIVFFHNPLTVLMNTPGDLVVQSNAPDGSPPNGIRRLNSGFYLARSTEHLLHALQDIVNLALHSNLTEQPCFYDILCGVEGEFRRGNDGCVKHNILTQFLDRDIFPNGATSAIWNSPPGTIRQRFPRAMILHNNWISGIQAKQNRMLLHGYSIFDEREDLCRYEIFEAPR